MKHNYGRCICIGQIILCAGSAIAYFVARDYRRAIYWTAASMITASVTF